MGKVIPYTLAAISVLLLAMAAIGTGSCLQLVLSARWHLYLGNGPFYLGFVVAFGLGLLSFYELQAKGQFLTFRGLLASVGFITISLLVLYLTLVHNRWAFSKPPPHFDTQESHEGGT
jgi:hypothetical protein